MNTALSLLYLVCECGDGLLVVVGECEECECELVLVEGDLVYHSFDFQDVPLVAVADVDLGALQVRVGQRVHCEFVRLLLEVVAVFECVEDTIARGDVGEFGEDLPNECWIEMRIDRRCASGGLFVVDEIHIGRDEFAVVGV